MTKNAGRTAYLKKRKNLCDLRKQGTTKVATYEQFLELKDFLGKVLEWQENHHYIVSNVGTGFVVETL